MKYAMMAVLAAMTATAYAAAPTKDAGSPAKQLFGKKCASCHAADGKGKESMAKMFKVKLEDLNLTADAVAKKSDADLVKIVTEGKNKMPKFQGKLKDAEIADLVAYIRTLAAAPAPAPAAAPAAK